MTKTKGEHSTPPPHTPSPSPSSPRSNRNNRSAKLNPITPHHLRKATATAATGSKPF
jgi:hypothetical protein